MPKQYCKSLFIHDSNKLSLDTWSTILQRALEIYHQEKINCTNSKYAYVFIVSFTPQVHRFACALFKRIINFFKKSDIASTQKTLFSSDTSLLPC